MSKIVSLAMDSADGEIIGSCSRVTSADVTRASDRGRGRSEWDSKEILAAHAAILRRREH
jgi:hypothetical protein